MSSTSVDKLARQLVALQRQVRQMQGQPQLAYSSLEDGAVTEYDRDGQLVQIIGKQHDGTHVAAPVAGPVPPTPSQPTVIPTYAGAKVVWDGNFFGNALVPMDFSRVEVHSSPTSDFDATTAATLRTTFETPRGGEKFIALPDGTHYIRLVARSMSGKASTASVQTPVIPISIADIGGNTIWKQASAPQGEHQIGDLWLQEPDNIAHRWDGDSWEPVRDQGIAQAIQDAFAAQQTADQAALDATAALAGLDGKVTSYRQPSPPLDASEGDFWQDSDDGNKLYRYEAGAWVVVQDASIQAAITAAATAQATADGKVRIFAQATAPTGLTAGDIGDVWIDISNGNRMHRWDTVETVVRENLAINGSFEYDAAAAATSTGVFTGWTNYSAGAAGTVTRGVYAASGLPAGGKYGRVISSSLGTAATDRIGVYQDFPCAPGDVMDVQARLWTGVADVDKPVRLHAEFRTAAGAFISQFINTGTGNTGYQTLAAQGTAPANAAILRVYLWRQGGGATALVNADLRMDAVAVERNRPTGAGSDYFDGSTGAGDEKLWTGEPHKSTSVTYERTTGTLGWKPNLLRSAAIQPKSLVARDVVATGTVSAALLETVLVLATTIIAGDPAGTHTRMDPTGFRSYLADPGGGAPDEVVRIGTEDDDTIGVVGTKSGVKQLLATIDRTGTVSAEKLVTRQWPTIDAEERAGVPGGDLRTILNRRARGLVGWGARYGNAPSTNSVAGVGIFEIRVRLYLGRMYKICTSVLRIDGTVAGDLAEVQARITRSSTTPGTQQTPTTPPATPTITSEILGRAHAIVGSAGALIEGTQITKLYAIGNVDDGQYVDARILLTYSRAVGTGTLTMQGHATSGDVIEMWVEDIGPSMGNLQVTNSGGGGLVQTPTRFNETFAPAWTTTWMNGGGTVRYHQNEMVQGRASDGTNGVQMAAVGWDQSVTDRLAGATIESVGLYMYATHWYYNAGGTVLLGRHSHAGVGGGPSTWQALPRVENMRQFHLDKPGGAWVDVPEGKEGWANGTVRGYVIGGPTGSDLNYYGRLAGYGQANQPLINITYTKVV